MKGWGPSPGPYLSLPVPCAWQGTSVILEQSSFKVFTPLVQLGSDAAEVQETNTDNE